MTEHFFQHRKVASWQRGTAEAIKPEVNVCAVHACCVLYPTHWWAQPSSHCMVCTAFFPLVGTSSSPLWASSQWWAQPSSQWWVQPSSHWWVTPSSTGGHSPPHWLVTPYLTVDTAPVLVGTTYPLVVNAISPGGHRFPHGWVTQSRTGGHRFRHGWVTQSPTGGHRLPHEWVT